MRGLHIAHLAKLNPRHLHALPPNPAGNFLNALKVVPPAALPSTLIIDKSGKIAVRVIGPIKEQSFKAVLESVLSKS